MSRKGFFCSFLIFLIAGCASYQFKVREARNMIESGDPSSAAQKLKPLALKPGDDQLVYLFDYATALQLAGNYKKSNQAFIRADDLAEFKDYHSVSRIAGSLVLNEGMVQYKGDPYEHVMTNALAAINFLMLGNKESALVEVRRMNEKLYLLKKETDQNFKQSVFGIYVGGMIWESDKEWDDAYIDYKKAYNLNPSIDLLKKDLLRASYMSGRKNEYRKWKRKFSNVQMRPEWRSENYGELILIYQQGWGPRKRPNPKFRRVPKLYPVNSWTQKAHLKINSEPKKTTEEIYSVEDIAMETLNSQYDELVAKRLAGMATKAVVADQIRQKNQLLGDLAAVGMDLADRADLRQWSTLPETFQVARVWLKTGEHKVAVQGLNSSGEPTGEKMAPKTVTIEPRKKTFIMWRSFH